MLSAEIPKTVTIIVKSGENLEYSIPGSKVTSKARKWCVVFIGGKKKMITEFIEAQNGCPVWDCEVTIDLLNTNDPVIMLVMDGDKHHIGQVVIPLTRIPRTGPPNFDPSRLQYSDLEPTKKNSHPRGRLTYWIWATGYWPPGTKFEGKSKLHIRRSKSKYQPHHGPASVGSFDDQNSTFSSDARSSRAPSMMSGAYSESNLSGETGYLGGGISAGSTLWSGIQPTYNGHLDVPGASYNPLAGCDDSVSVVGAQPSTVTGLPPIYHPAMYHGYGSDSGSVATVNSKKSKGILKKMRRSLSQSTHNLKSIARKAGGDKLYKDSGSVLSIASSKHHPALPDSTSTIVGRFPNGSVTSLYQHDTVLPDNTARSSVIGSLSQTQPVTVVNTILPSSDVLKSPAKDISKDRLNDSLSSLQDTSGWGMHPEERGKKPLEEMSHRELVNYAMHLERSAQVTRAELARVQGEREELAKKSAATEQDLDSVRLDLADLRVRLLKAGLTEFLERPESSPENGSPAKCDDRKRAMSLGIGRPIDTPQSFLDRLTALTANTRKLTSSTDATLNVPQVAPSTDWW